VRKTNRRARHRCPFIEKQALGCHTARQPYATPVPTQPESVLKWGVPQALLDHLTGIELTCELCGTATGDTDECTGLLVTFRLGLREEMPVVRPKPSLIVCVLCSSCDTGFRQLEADLQL
jgi:hypothetical protein